MCAAVRARSTATVKHIRKGETSATWGERVAHAPGDGSSRTGAGSGIGGPVFKKVGNGTIPTLFQPEKLRITASEDKPLGDFAACKPTFPAGLCGAAGKYSSCVGERFTMRTKMKTATTAR